MTPEEVGALTHEAARLIQLGRDATRAEWTAFIEQKIDVLDRIAMDPGPFIDDAEAAEIREMARREALALRLAMHPGGGEW